MDKKRKSLVEGFDRFRKKYYQSGNDLMQELEKEGAHPGFLVINCIDPRSCADTVFNTQPGDIAVNSQMAAIVPPYDPDQPLELKASLKYLVDVKQIKHIVILGHSSCGGCEALISGTNDKDIAPWVETAKSALKKAKHKVGDKDQKALQEETEKQVIIQSIKNLMEYPVVKNAFMEGRITVNGWYFELKHGKLHEYDVDKNNFVEMRKASPKRIPDSKQKNIKP